MSAGSAITNLVCIPAVLVTGQIVKAVHVQPCRVKSNFAIPYDWWL